MKKIFYRYAPSFLKKALINRYINKYSALVKDKNVEEVFTEIFTNQRWGNEETRSGLGSTLQETIEIRKIFPDLFQKYKIQRLLDVPCGDFNWMQKVDLSAVDYIGGDIVNELIQNNNKNFKARNIKFDKINIIEDALPPSDLLICRDCFVHLTIDQIQKSIANIMRHDIKYLLVTSFPHVIENEDIVNGLWRPLNMERRPFNLKSIASFDEKSPAVKKDRPKHLILIDLKN